MMKIIPLFFTYIISIKEKKSGVKAKKFWLCKKNWGSPRVEASPFYTDRLRLGFDY